MRKINALAPAHPLWNRLMVSTVCSLFFKLLLQVSHGPGNSKTSNNFLTLCLLSHNQLPRCVLSIPLNEWNTSYFFCLSSFLILALYSFTQTVFREFVHQPILYKQNKPNIQPHQKNSAFSSYISTFFIVVFEEHYLR